jgi:flagellar basal body rod protein FlgG
MLIADATMRALSDVAARERDTVRIFTPADPVDENSTPAVAPPDAYFVTRDERGRALFTRGGRFTIRDGALTDAGGEPVLGYAKEGAPLQPLHIGAIDRALGFGAGVRIEADGAVTYDRLAVDPRSRRRETQRVTIGRLALARFAPGTKLQAVDGRHLAAPAGVAPHFGMPGDGNFSHLASPIPERNVNDLDDALQRMQEAYLAIDAIRVAGLAQNGVQKTAMDLLK